MANPVHIQKYLKGVDYPITKPELIEKAKENKIDKESLQVLIRIPGQKFDNTKEVSKAIGRVKMEVK